MSKVTEFIDAVKEEKEGFSFEKPWRLEKSSLGVILPILRKSKKKRDYISFAEAQQIKVEDTGQIDHVYVKNMEDKPVYISRGEIFRGKTQERAAIHGYMVMPNQGLRVAVRCVHQSKGIQAGADMKYGGRAPYAVDLSSQNKAWESVQNYTSSYLMVTGSELQAKSLRPQSLGSLRARSCFAADMSEGSFTADMSEGSVGIGSAGPISSLEIPAADDLVSTIGDLSSSIKEIMKKIPFIKNQVGAMFFKENSLIGMDVYDLPDSWDVVKKDVVEKEGSSFIEQNGDDMFEFKPEKAKKLAKKRLSTKFEEKEVYNKEYTVIELRSDEALGEAVIFKDKVIHLTLWQNSKN